MMNMSRVDIRYFYGEPLISMNRFAELFLYSLAYQDGMLDLNESKVKAKLPLDYEDKIADYIDNVGNKEEISTLIDLDFYYNNTDIWYKEINSMLNYYVKKDKEIKIDSKSDKDNIIITMSAAKAFSVVDNYDKDIAKYMIDLTSYVNRKEETELERLGKMIEQVGIEKVKTK